MDTPSVACILTTFKRPGRAMDALESILAQDYPSLEIIVVEDNLPGSRESVETRERLLPLLESCGGRLLGTTGARGAPEARNLGVRETRAPFLAFLDDDDIWLPGKISRQMESLKTEGKRSSYVYCTLEYHDDDGRLVGRRHIPPGADPFRTHILKQLAPTSCLVIRRSAFDAVGGFADIPAGQDYELQLRLLSSGGVAWVGEPLVHLRVHSGERISSGSGKVIAAKRLAEIKRTYYPRLARRDRLFLEAESLGNIGKYLVRSGAPRDGFGPIARSLLIRPWSPRRWAWFIISAIRSIKPQ